MKFFSLKEGSAAVHGAPLGANDVAQLKSKYNFDPSQVGRMPDHMIATLMNNIFTELSYSF
jgi:transketolase